MSALRLINETEITSPIQQVNITNVFSADFDIYKITADDLRSSTQTIYPSLRFIDTSNTVISSSVYDLAKLETKTGNTGITFPETRTVNGDWWYELCGSSGTSSTTNAANVGYIFNPYNSSSYTFGLWKSASQERWDKKIGVFKQTSSITGFSLVSSDATRNIKSGLVRTYGLRVDS